MIEVMTSNLHLAPKMPFSWKQQVNNLQKVTSGTRWQSYPLVLLLTEATDSPRLPGPAGSIHTVQQKPVRLPALHS